MNLPNDVARCTAVEIWLTTCDFTVDDQCMHCARRLDLREQDTFRTMIPPPVFIEGKCPSRIGQLDE